MVKTKQNKMKTEQTNLDGEIYDSSPSRPKRPFEYLSVSICKNFNFEKVHKAMVALDWNWSFGTDSDGIENYGIPSIETIKNHALSLLRQAYDSGMRISTGGFSAGWDCGELFLVFTLEEDSAS